MEKIDKMKHKRLLHAKLPGKSIAEEAEEEKKKSENNNDGDDGDALAWVQKSRLLV
jgi:hypothetical protein